MCGIAGMFRWDGQAVAPALLERMTGILAHRGPEASGVRLITDGSLSIGLGHTRLKIVDLSEAAGQPMGEEASSVWVTFNGEIYNFQELRAWLEQQGYRFRTTSDTEVLLRLYEAEGPSCVSRLEGMFAFAIWDGRRRQLLIARDRVGKKPLFYHTSPTHLAFASEIKALLRDPAIVPEVHTEALPAFFLYGYVPTPETCYRGILALPPGCLLQVGVDGRAQIRPYWDVPLSSPSDGRVPSERDAIARIRELMTAAVRRRLIADVPLGAFLSGGVDSSIVVGLMSRLLREPVRTFSIGFAGDRRFDETSYARLAARRFGTRHTEFIMEPSSVELVERLVWHHDGPFGDSSAIPTYLLARLTRQHVTVALTGDGGDELFAGYLRFAATLLSERIPVALRRYAHALLAGWPVRSGSRSLAGRLHKFSEGAALPFTERFSRWSAIFYEDLPRLMPDGLGAQGGAGNGSPAPLKRLTPYLTRSANASPLTQLLYLNMKTYLPDDLLVKMDRCAMAHALEARSPFLDHHLVEFAAKLPAEYKMKNFVKKYILKKAIKDILPYENIHRRKMGFGVPVGEWLRGDMKGFLRETLLSDTFFNRGYFRPDAVKDLVNKHLRRQADFTFQIWALLMLELWHRRFID